MEIAHNANATRLNWVEWLCVCVSDRVRITWWMRDLHRLNACIRKYHRIHWIGKQRLRATILFCRFSIVVFTSVAVGVSYSAVRRWKRSIDFCIAPCALLCSSAFFVCYIVRFISLSTYCVRSEQRQSVQYGHNDTHTPKKSRARRMRLRSQSRIHKHWSCIKLNATNEKKIVFQKMTKNKKKKRYKIYTQNAAHSMWG